jgi:hypothetical protein
MNNEEWEKKPLVGGNWITDMIALCSRPWLLKRFLTYLFWQGIVPGFLFALFLESGVFAKAIPGFKTLIQAAF